MSDPPARLGATNQNERRKRTMNETMTLDEASAKVNELLDAAANALEADDIPAASLLISEAERIQRLTQQHLEALEERQEQPQDFKGFWRVNGPLRWLYRLGSVALIGGMLMGAAETNNTPSYSDPSSSNVVGGYEQSANTSDTLYRLAWQNSDDDVRKAMCFDYSVNGADGYLRSESERSAANSFFEFECVGEYAN